MLSADELFMDGKVRIAREEFMKKQQEDDGLMQEEKHRMLSSPWREFRSFNENPRCASMTMAGARETPLRTCISLTNSRCSSPSRSFSLPSTTPTSPRTASSSKRSSRFKEFFKLKKLHVPSSEIAHDHIAAVAASSCRLPISPRSFWPFSRSNSAGERKSAPQASPSPRRSNSAGESKSSSSSQAPPGNNAASRSTIISDKLPTAPHAAQSKKGLPPLPISNSKKSSGNHNSFLITLNCGADHAVALSSQSAFSSIPTVSGTLPPNSKLGVHKCPTSANVAIGSKPNIRHSNFAGNAQIFEGEHRTRPDYLVGCRSPGRPVRKGTSTVAGNFARNSPGRRGVWSSTAGIGNVGRAGTIRNMDRCNNAPNVRLNIGPDRPPIAYTTSVRVTPVLNVPVCMGPSFRGGKSSSKSKIFSLGNLFSKKEKATGSYAVLPTSDRQNGA